jgi:hypothetical protein
VGAFGRKKAINGNFGALRLMAWKKITSIIRVLNVPFPVRDAEGHYRGCLEVSLDLTDIRKLEGQNRLLDRE